MTLNNCGSDLGVALVFRHRFVLSELSPPLPGCATTSVVRNHSGGGLSGLRGDVRGRSGDVYVSQGVREMYDFSSVAESAEDSDGVGEVCTLILATTEGLNDRVRTSLEATA